MSASAITFRTKLVIAQPEIHLNDDKIDAHIDTFLSIRQAFATSLVTRCKSSNKLLPAGKGGQQGEKHLEIGEVVIVVERNHLIGLDDVRAFGAPFGGDAGLSSTASTCRATGAGAVIMAQ